MRAALDGPAARLTRHGPASGRDARIAGNLIAARRAATARADAHWVLVLAAAGFDTLEQAVAWAQENATGWAGLAARLGCSQTPLRRRGEAQGLTLERVRPTVTGVRLAEASAHAAQHGSLAGTSGDLARWLAGRRHLRTTGVRSDIDAALDALDPQWHKRRRPTRLRDD